MDFVTPIVTPVVESLLIPVKRHLGFLISSSNKVKDVHDKEMELDGAANDMHTQLVSSRAHMRVVPHRVPDWLAEVQIIKAEIAKEIPTGRVGCFNLNMRYKAGRDSANILKRIDRLMKEKAEMVWANEITPLGAVSPLRPPTSLAVYEDANQTNDIIESRRLIFKDALKSLDPNNIKTQKIALCGMAGVGKTTMMEDMLKAANDRKMFDYIVKVVVGQNPNLALVQQTVAEQTGETLKETTNDTRAKRLKERFKVRSEEGKQKILVILDDVWEVFNLEDIGLVSPLGNGFKLFLTSREETACIGMGVEASSIFKIELLKYPEDKNLFWETTGLGSHSDITDLLQIGEDIIKRCGGLPIAIKTIASTLKCIKERDEWNHALFCIQNKDFPVIINIFEFSYKNLKEDDLKATFLLSGLFPEDSNIGIEDLVMYGWGLKFFKNDRSIEEARYRVNTYVNRLIRSNLLIKSDREGCVKMHDLVRDFVLSSFSNVMKASLGNHNINVSQQLKEEESYERILLKCKDMLEFPLDFNHPNLKLLKLMGGHKLLKFPIDFYTRMDKLEVIAYNDMHLPLLPHYSTNLRVLCLRSCSLGDNDVSFIGDLINLEVLDLAYCGIHKLPSKLGKLKRLKLLDLSECVNLHIDNGVFKNLDQLEELYMGVCEPSSIRFSDTNCDELKILSRHLSALELEFFHNKAQPVNVSFENLKRFKISIGCSLDRRLVNRVGDYSFKNTLKLETSSRELRECKINELFKETEILHMEVNDMSSLEYLLKHPPQKAFCNLKELKISNCKGLAYLFTISMAKSLTKLEKLFVTSCSVLQFVVNGKNSETEVVKFDKLKFLSLHNLPKLVSLCGHVSGMDLPQLMNLDLDGLPNYTSIFPKNNINISSGQPFFNKEVLIPKLETLTITGMKNLKDIWECEITASEGEVNNIFMLREIKVRNCNGVVNLFPNNPMRLLTHFEELIVERCGSVEVLFNIELGQIRQLSRCSLRKIKVWQCKSLREVWRIKGAEDNYFIDGFQDVETIDVCACKKFRNIVTPTTANFNTRALKNFNIADCDEYGERNDELDKNSQEQEINKISKERISKADDNLSTVAFTSHQITHNFHQLRNIRLRRVTRVEVVFEMESPSNRDQIETTQHQQQQPLLPYLEVLKLMYMKKLSHVWKCKSWSEFFILHKHQPLSSFQNISTIYLSYCPSIKYLFSPLMVKLLSNLKEVDIWQCNGMEEVVSNRDDDEEMTSSTYAHTTTTLFPRLRFLQLDYMKNLKHIGGQSRTATDASHGQSKVSQDDVVSWSLCQYMSWFISNCDALSSVIPYYVAGQPLKLQELSIKDCKSMMEVFESKEITNNNDSGCNSSATVAISRPAYSNVHMLPHLKILKIDGCDCLENVFTFSTLESLKELEKLMIRKCGAITMIVKEEVREDTSALSKNVVFTNLKSIELGSLPNLAGFFLGVNIDFEWPLLEYVEIVKCPQLMVFTSGHSTTPRLKYINTELGQHNLKFGLNIHQTPSTGLDCISSNPSIPEGRTWSFHNLIQCKSGSSLEDTKIFPYHELQHLNKLETIHICRCKNVEEVFEVALEVTNNESQTSVKFPKLREVDLQYLSRLKYIWKSNQWRKLEFPNLTRLSIEGCYSLEHVFTCSMVGCVMQLQELHIQYCEKMKAIVKEEEEDCDAKVSEIIEFPSLKSLKLHCLSSLKGFCLGKEDFTFPSLNTMEIRYCSKIMVLTEGHSIIPEKTVVETKFGSFNVGEDINSFILTKKQEGFSF